MKMSNRIGIIAEDKSDIAVLRTVLLKYVDNNSFGIKKFIGRGCGRICKKCYSWASTLKAMGCSHLFVVHDLDDRDEKELRSNLEALVNDSEFRNALVIIPILEMEAWLLSDPIAIKSTFHLGRTPRLIPNTETINDPKEYLRDLVWRLGGKRYLNTVHNERIASKTSLTALRRCKSFRPLDRYIKRNLKN